MQEHKDIMSIPGIRKIGVVRASAISPMACQLGDVGIKPVLLDLPEMVNFFGKASLGYVSEKLKVKTTLTFNTLDDITSRDMAFVVEDLNRQRFLIGCREDPQVVLKYESDTGDSPSGAVTRKYTVTWPCRPIPVIVWMPEDDNLPLRGKDALQ